MLSRQDKRLNQWGQSRTLNTCIVVLIDEQRLDDDENLVNEWPHQLVQLVQDPINDLQTVSTTP